MAKCCLGCLKGLGVGSVDANKRVKERRVCMFSAMTRTLTGGKQQLMRKRGGEQGWLSSAQGRKG